MSQIIILLIIVLAVCQHIYSQNTFYIPFQSGSIGATNPSTKQWIEFQNKFKDTKDLSNCQWIRIKYFNMDTVAQLWSYCELESRNATMTCLQLWLSHSPKSGNRNLNMNLGFLGGRFSGRDKTLIRSVEVKNLLHRTWISFCLTMSSINDSIKFYYNGKMIKEFKKVGGENIVTTYNFMVN